MLIKDSTRPYFASYYRWLVASQRLGVDLTACRVLDVGTDDATFLRRSSAALRVGVDLAPRARSHDAIEIIRADARALPVLDGSFDCVLAFDVLEHIEDDRSVMREMLRVLSPHGTLWFSTPARDTIFWPRLMHPYANRVFGHVRNGYTVDQLISLIPDKENWHIDMFFWNEPLLRTTFGALHVLDRLIPLVADVCTRQCYRFDQQYADGERGHIFGYIRRRLDVCG